MVEWIRHNQGMFTAILIAAGLLVWTYGCQSQVGSLSDPARLVTREQLKLELQGEQKRLEAELDLLAKQAELKAGQLDRQDAIKQKLYDFASLAAQTGELNPIGIVTLVGSVLGLGAVVDNRIKDKVIKNRPLQGGQK